MSLAFNPSALLPLLAIALPLVIAPKVANANGARALKISAPAGMEKSMPYSVAMESKNQRIWTANYGFSTLTVRAAEDGRLLDTITVGKNPTCIVLDEARGTAYSVNSGEDSVTLIDLNSLTKRETVPVGRRPQMAAVDSRNGRVWVTNCGENTVSVLGGPGQNQLILPTGSAPAGIAIDSQRRRIFVANSTQKSLSTFDADSFSSAGTITLSAPALNVATHPKLGLVYAAHAENNLLTILAPGKMRGGTQVNTGDYPAGILVDSTRNLVYLANYGEGSITALDAESGQHLYSGPTGKWPLGLGLNPANGQVLVTGVANNSLDIITVGNIPQRQAEVQLVATLETTQPLENQVQVSETKFTTEADLPVAVEVLPSQPPVANFGGGYSTDLPAQPTTDWAPATPTFPNWQQPAPKKTFQYQLIPSGALGNRIAREAARLHSAGISGTFHRQCDRLTDTTVRNVTSEFNSIMGPRGNDTAARTMRRFQKAGLGFAFSAGIKLAPGDLLYADERAGNGSGHSMVVGPKGHIMDQYGARTSPVARPVWVVRPDDVRKTLAARQGRNNEGRVAMAPSARDISG